MMWGKTKGNISYLFSSSSSSTSWLPCPPSPQTLPLFPPCPFSPENSVITGNLIGTAGLSSLKLWTGVVQVSSWNISPRQNSRTENSGEIVCYFSASAWNCKRTADCRQVDWRELNSKFQSLCQFKGEGEMARMELTDIDSSINDDNKLLELPWTHLYFYFTGQSWNPLEY